MMSLRSLLVCVVVLISLIGIGFCQFEDDPTDDFPPESSSRLPAFPDDYQLDPSITDQKPQTSLTFDQSTFPSFTSKIKATSEPPVAPTTQADEPEPSDEPLDFYYPDDPTSGPACVRLCFKSATIRVPYKATDEFTGEVVQRSANISITSKAQVGGRCGNGKNEPTRLYLQWGTNLLKFTFIKTRSGDTDNWEANPIQFTYNTSDMAYFENAVDAGERVVRTNPEIEFFESPWRSSYKCNSDSEVNMTSTDKSETGSLLLKELQLQPFMEEKANGKWGEVEQCESDKIVKPTSNVASVAVGATLGCLILIVIIVYAVGRKMGSITDRTGYKSVE